MASDFKVTLLGTGDPQPIMKRFGPSTLVEAGEQKLLFDCGRGTMQRINQTDTNASTFNKLFLTHLHSDHTTGIPDLWITGHLRGRKETPLQVWGPPGTTEMTKHIQKAYKIDLQVRRETSAYNNRPWNTEGLRIEAQDILEGFVYEENGVKVIPFSVNHHDAYSEVASLGYRIEYNGRVVVLSGDTRYCENLIKYSDGVDLLVHEVAAAPLGEEISSRYSTPLRHHTSPEECGKLFSIVKPRLAVFTHVIQFKDVSSEEMITRTRTDYDGPLVMGEDLMQIEVGDKVRILNP